LGGIDDSGGETSFLSEDDLIALPRAPGSAAEPTCAVPDAGIALRNENVITAANFLALM
jgi:hypothetical protein